MTEELTEQEKKTFNQAVINNNKVVSEQSEHGIYSSKVVWLRSFFCCQPGCQEKTCLTRRINMSVVAKMIGKEPVDYFQPLCETHFRETHAIGMLEIAENGFTGEMNE